MPLHIEREEREERRDRDPKNRNNPWTWAASVTPGAHPSHANSRDGPRSWRRRGRRRRMAVPIGDRGHRRVPVGPAGHVRAPGSHQIDLPIANPSKMPAAARSHARRPRRPRRGRGPHRARRRRRRRGAHPPVGRALRSSTGRARRPALRSSSIARTTRPGRVRVVVRVRWFAGSGGTSSSNRNPTPIARATVWRSSSRWRCRSFVAASPAGCSARAPWPTPDARVEPLPPVGVFERTHGGRWPPPAPPPARRRSSAGRSRSAP